MLKARESVRTLKEYHPPLGNREGLRLVGVEPEELLLTNGTDEAIHIICETYLEPGDEALIVVPTFAMYEIYAAATGARAISIPAAADFKFPTERVLANISKRTRFIAVANPNNPTGAFAEIRDLTRIAEAAPDAALLVDEAYFEFCSETMAPKWRQLPNLFVSRTFSKAYGMAGLRIGVLMGTQDQVQMLRRASSPYNLNSVALACLPDALADQSYVQDYVGQALDGRRDLENELSLWGIHFWTSRANFVLMHLGDKCKPFINEMREGGILVRNRSSDYGCQDCVRITVGIREHNERLLASLREVFAGLGLREKVTR